MRWRRIPGRRGPIRRLILGRLWIEVWWRARSAEPGGPAAIQEREDGSADDE